MAEIEKIRLNGKIYDIKDTISGYATEVQVEEVSNQFQDAHTLLQNQIQEIDTQLQELGVQSQNYMVKGVDYVTAGQKSGTTLGDGATAEGRVTTASGNNSHVEGLGTVAASKSQHVFGEYNIQDGPSISSKVTERGTYVEIVGKGTADNMRSNARTLDWDGNEVLAGKLTVGSNPTNSMDVTTKEYVDTQIASLSSTLIVNLSATALHSAYSLDKTFEEITDAVENEYFVYLNYNEEVGYLNYIDSNKISFVIINENILTTVTIWDDDFVELMELPYVPITSIGALNHTANIYNENGFIQTISEGNTTTFNPTMTYKTVFEQHPTEVNLGFHHKRVSDSEYPTQTGNNINITASGVEIEYLVSGFAEHTINLNSSAGSIVVDGGITGDHMTAADNIAVGGETLNPYLFFIGRNGNVHGLSTLPKPSEESGINQNYNGTYYDDYATNRLYVENAVSPKLNKSAISIVNETLTIDLS